MAEGIRESLPPYGEKRRAARFGVFVPVEAKWSDSSGNTIKETGEAKEVNAVGGLLDMRRYPKVGTKLELTNLLSKETAEARLAGIRRTREGAVLGVAVELVEASESFWGVNFQLKKTSAQLAQIGEVIKTGGVEPRILREFRDAVDYVRKTAWAVQEWQERQLKQHDPQTVLPLITAERIRRVTQLSEAITADLAARELSRDTAGMEDLFRAVEGLYQRIAELFADHSRV
jgi:hypothetical protein